MNELHSVCRFAPTVSGADWCRQRVDRVGVLFQLNWQTADCGRTSVGRMWALSMRVYVAKHVCKCVCVDRHLFSFM